MIPPRGHQNFQNVMWHKRCTSKCPTGRSRVFIKWNIKRLPRVPRSSAKRNWSGSGSSSIRRYCVRQKYRYRKNVGSRPVFDAFTVRWTICVSGYSNIYRHVFSILAQVLDCCTGTYIHSWSQKYSYIFKYFFCIWSLTCYANCNFLFEND